MFTAENCPQHLAIYDALAMLTGHGGRIVLTQKFREGDHFAFVITASQKSGRVESVEILSEAGATCRLRNPWGDAAVTLTRDGAAPERINGTLLSLPIAQGKRVRLTRD